MSRDTDTTSSQLDCLNGAGWLLLTERERAELKAACRRVYRPVITRDGRVFPDGLGSTPLLFRVDYAEIERRIVALRGLDSAVAS